MGKAKKASSKGRKMVQMSRSHAVMLGCFMLFLFFWMFVLGVFVGKGIIPRDRFNIKSPISRARALLGLDEKVKYEPPKEDSLEFYSELEREKRSVKVENLLTAEDKIPGHQITLSREAEDQPAEKNMVRGVIKPRGKEEKGSLPVRAAAETPLKDGQQVQIQPSSSKGVRSATKDKAVEFYSVQIAAISDQKMAEKMEKELADQGYDAYYYTATVNGKRRYRIMCGRFSLQSDADQYRLRLKKELGYNGFVSKVEEK
ncbi:MAG: SPOR domain-containing protein [Deltaproteobacteria bacterium]|nr:SPOR domain-containing protein [Deltaproteobacteria bacterium]